MSSLAEPEKIVTTFLAKAGSGAHEAFAIKSQFNAKSSKYEPKADEDDL
jgi:hypothetical protein